MVSTNAPPLLLIPLFLSSQLVLILVIFFIRRRTASSTTHHEISTTCAGIDPPGTSGWPFIGEAIDLIRAFRQGTPERFVKERREKYVSDVFKTSIMGLNVVVLSGPLGSKFLFTNEEKLVRTWWLPSAKRLFGKCLLTEYGEVQIATRSMMASFVSPDLLSRVYIRTMDLVSRQHIDSHWIGKQLVEVFPTIKSHWFEVACRLFMSLDNADEIAEHAHLFHVFLEGLITIPISIPGTRFYKAKKVRCRIRNWLLKIVGKRRDALKQTTITDHPQDLLSHMLISRDKTGKFMSVSDIVSNLHVLLMAGHDVSIAAMTMLMKKLAQFPEIYEKVLREQQEIASLKAEGQREFLQWEDIEKMKYSWNVICESMRMWPPIQGALREAIVDINYQGYHIPKGSKLYWSAHLTHSDPKLHPNPEKFDPSRFEKGGSCSYSFIAFGGGPRMCLGKEYARVQMLVFLHNVITRFKWKLVYPEEKIEYPVGMPEKGLPIILDDH